MPFKAPAQRFFVANTTAEDIYLAIEGAASKLSWKIESSTPNNAALSWPDKPSRYKETVQRSGRIRRSRRLVSSVGLRETEGCSDPDGVGGNVTPYYTDLCLKAN